MAKEAREKDEEAQTSLSIRAVYRQLVAALHPDREPDLAERERKTELMKQVTVAYGKKDLLELLALQLRVEQIDQSSINSIGDERLRHYNKVLLSQLQELQDEVMSVEMDFKAMTRVAPYEALTPKRVQSILKVDIARLRYDTKCIARDVNAFREIKQLKAWLKDYRIPEPDFDFFL